MLPKLKIKATFEEPVVTDKKFLVLRIAGDPPNFNFSDQHVTRITSVAVTSTKMRKMSQTWTSL